MRSLEGGGPSFSVISVLGSEVCPNKAVSGWWPQHLHLTHSLKATSSGVRAGRTVFPGGLPPWRAHGCLSSGLSSLLLPASSRGTSETTLVTSVSLHTLKTLSPSVVTLGGTLI